MTTAREDHTNSKPQPDGKVELLTTDGELHSHLFSHENNWTHEPFGIVFKEKHKRSVFPWTNIVSYDVWYNSPEYNQQMLGWLKDCDHDWLTHPQVGHYCKFCRLDMRDLDKLYQDDFEEPPALVVTDPSVDREAQNHEGGPDSDPLSGAQPQTGVALRIVSLDEDPSTFCECDDGTTPHDGPCRVDPATWPIREIGPDEDGNTQF